MLAEFYQDDQVQTWPVSQRGVLEAAIKIEKAETELPEMTAC